MAGPLDREVSFAEMAGQYWELQGITALVARSKQVKVFRCNASRRRDELCEIVHEEMLAERCVAID